MSDVTNTGPHPRVYGVAIRRGEALLVRASKPHDGEEMWWLPGGGIDFGESPATALRREFIEETGLEVLSELLIDVLDDTRTRPNGQLVHSLRVIYMVVVDDGEPQAEADGTTDHVEWVPMTKVLERRLAPYAEQALSTALQILNGSSGHHTHRVDAIETLRNYAGL